MQPPFLVQNWSSMVGNNDRHGRFKRSESNHQWYIPVMAGICVCKLQHLHTTSSLSIPEPFLDARITFHVARDLPLLSFSHPPFLSSHHLPRMLSENPSTPSEISGVLDLHAKMARSLFFRTCIFLSLWTRNRCWFHDSESPIIHSVFLNEFHM